MRTNGRTLGALCAVSALCALGQSGRAQATFDGKGGQDVQQGLPDVQARAKELREQGTFVTVIEKKPKEIIQDGPILIYRYNTSAIIDYQWVVVRSEQDKQLVIGLLKALKTSDGSETVGVRTLSEYIDEMQGRYWEERAAKLTAELQEYLAVVYSYENPR